MSIKSTILLWGTIISTVYIIILILIQVRNFFKKKRKKISSFLKRKVEIPSWVLLILLIILTTSLIIDKFPEKEKPKIKIIEELFGGKSYYVGIEIPRSIINKDKLICRLPKFIDITELTPEAEPFETDKENVYSWEGKNIIQMDGDTLGDMPCPYDIKSKFDPPTIKMRENTKLIVEIFRKEMISQKFNEFLGFYFPCMGCDIKIDDKRLKKIVEARNIGFFGYIDLDENEINTFKFNVSAITNLRPEVEITYFSDGIINCTFGKVPIDIISRITDWTKFDELNVSS